MSKNRKGMHKEWHSKRIDYDIEMIFDFLKFLGQTYNFEETFGPEVAQAYLNFCDALYEENKHLEIEVYCGQYLVEYGYNWVSDNDVAIPANNVDSP